MTETMERFTHEYDAGTILFREGDAGEHMYVVQSGVVRITRSIASETRILADVSAGDFFGEMAILNNSPRSATATVVEPTRLLTIGHKTFESMIKARSDIAVRLVKVMAQRLERTNRQLETLLVQDGTYRVVRILSKLATKAPKYGTDSKDSVFVDISLKSLAANARLPETELLTILRRLSLMRLVVFAKEAGIKQSGLLIPERRQLADFVEFLELRNRTS